MPTVLTVLTPSATPTTLALGAPTHHAYRTNPGLPLPQTDDFVEFFRMHYPRLLRALTLAGAARPEAEDLAQESFARALRHWRRVRRGDNPPGYLFRVAFRLLHRSALFTAPLTDDTGSSPGPEQQVMTTLSIERALQALPARRRACAVMCLCLDMSTADTAEALGIAPGTVRKQVELARRDLRLDLSVGEDPSS